MCVLQKTETEKTILSFIAPARLTLVSLIDNFIMGIPLTPVLDTIITVFIEVYRQCFIASVTQRELRAVSLLLTQKYVALTLYLLKLSNETT